MNETEKKTTKKPEVETETVTETTFTVEEVATPPFWASPKFRKGLIYAGCIVGAFALGRMFSTPALAEITEEVEEDSE